MSKDQCRLRRCRQRQDDHPLAWPFPHQFARSDDDKGLPRLVGVVLSALLTALVTMMLSAWIYGREEAKGWNELCKSFTYLAITVGSLGLALWIQTGFKIDRKKILFKGEIPRKM